MGAWIFVIVILIGAVTYQIAEAKLTEQEQKHRREEEQRWIDLHKTLDKDTQKGNHI